jgi:hypothetical protein
MLSQTLRALEDFDNQHDFERMAADILNALGYLHVEPMAPGGGSDSGRDINFKEGDVPGIAFVTLEKNIRGKFTKDLAKQPTAEGVIAIFCNVKVSPRMKLTFAQEAIAKGFRLEVFDLERLRSLLDSNLKEVRRRYLKIDDEVAARIRSEFNKLIRFPDAIADKSVPPTMIETMLVDQLARRAFDLLINFQEEDIKEVPEIGGALHNHLTMYYQFRKNALRVESNLMSKIGALVSVRFRGGWTIYLRYVIMRFGGFSKDQIMAGPSFLNYSITWDDAERVFTQLSADVPISSEVADMFKSYQDLSRELPGR